ncbi:DUF3139 domain-containing protein [Paenibacillus sp. Soil750]|uniref:DUF3139 domain-containing protein n=1 Tax=Paenibacillus sp. Soil750 TaxID=1736398 RepID=UPI00070129C9|nr:DUF3139 domain-containing protein [Paenibacillus sp. Soil750]KRE70839.1 hypothetical protein ASL11_11130 [Paenibacillus sp. Soil750]
MPTIKSRGLWASLCIIALFILSIYFFVEAKKSNLEKDLQAYLVNEKQYEASEIFEIKAYFGKVPQIGAYVLFKDEPGVYYTYTDRGVGQWIQIGPSDADIRRGIQYKHLDEGRK